MERQYKYQVIALIGKSAAGKDTIQKETVRLHPNFFHPIVSCTTRPQRDYERDGVDYHFISVEDFTLKVLNYEMLEATEFNDWFYGTPIDSLRDDRINIGVFNPAGVEALLQDPRVEVSVIEVWASDKARLLRSLKREENPNCAEICRRYFADENDFSDLDFEPLARIDTEKERTADLMKISPNTMKGIYERALADKGKIGQF